MAYKQPIIVPNNKQYALTSNFNKGFDSNTADGVIDDSTFRDMLNMISDENGNPKKRNGHSLSEIQNLVLNYISLQEGALYTNDPNIHPDDPLFDQISQNLYSGKVNGVDVPEGMLRDTLIDEFIYMKGHFYRGTEDETMNSSYDKLLALHILDDSLITNPMDDSYNINDYASTIFPSLEFIAILGGEITGYADINGNSVWSTYSQPTFKYVYVKLTEQNYYSEAVAHDIHAWVVDYEINYDLCDYVDRKYNLSTDIYDSGYLQLNQYNNNIYFASGYDIFKISKDLDGFGGYLGYVISPITGSNAYKPNAIEVQNVGFNVLADTPLTYYENSGSAAVIRGVFYTMDIGSGVYEPIQTIPLNKSFRINVIRTSSAALGKPQYRPDNGDVDDNTNTWTEMAGSYTGDIFTCTEFNVDGKFEMRILITGGVTYRGYFTTSAPTIPEIGRVSTVSSLIKSSKYSTIIGSQLVLYGGHGYIFFSDYDNFSYFPNYYYVYAVETSDDEVVKIKYFRQYYAVFTKKIIKKMSGIFGSDNFSISKLNDFIGCSNPNTVQQVENNLIFMAQDGLYKLKQGYTGEGAENVEQIDLTVLGSYNPDISMNAIVKGTKYILTLDSKAIIYDFKQNAFYKYEYGKDSTQEYTPIFANNQSFNYNYIGLITPSALDDYKTYKKETLDNRYWHFVVNDNNPSYLTLVAEAKADIDAVVASASAVSAIDTIVSDTLSQMTGGVG